ncbi:hypothetical protein [Jiella marina]|nr:hypothetical protein [Jiella sp. LLJ827]MCQ0988551.1 hypothetical protein [Jiella sp. LLJ827]
MKYFLGLSMILSTLAFAGCASNSEFAAANSTDTGTTPSNGIIDGQTPE